MQWYLYNVHIVEFIFRSINIDLNFERVSILTSSLHHVYREVDENGLSTSRKTLLSNWILAQKSASTRMRVRFRSFDAPIKPTLRASYRKKRRGFLSQRRKNVRSHGEYLRAIVMSFNVHEKRTLAVTSEPISIMKMWREGIGGGTKRRCEGLIKNYGLSVSVPLMSLLCGNSRALSSPFSGRN